MKAIVLHGKDGNYRYESNWQDPAKPDGWAIAKVAYSGVCGSDIPRFASNGSYRHPMILGHEFSGTVYEPSNKEGSLCKGTPVAVSPIIPCGICNGCLTIGPFHCSNYQFIGSRNDGGFAEFCAVPEDNLVMLGSINDLKAGCFFEPMAVGLHAVRKSGFKAGKSAIVFGAGPIGLLIGLWLEEFGASRVIMADIKTKNVEMAKDFGFEAVDLSKVDISDLDMVDFAFEAAGSGKALNDAISILNGNGTLTVVGRDVNDTVIPVGAFEKLMRKEIRVLGCWGYDIRGEQAFVSKILSKNTKRLEKLISHVVPVEEAEIAINDMCNQNIEYCKVIISFI